MITLCPETMSRNLPKLSLNLPNRHKNWIGQKRSKKTNLIYPYFKNLKIQKSLKGQKLQIWPQKSQTVNIANNRRAEIWLNEVEAIFS